MSNKEFIQKCKLLVRNYFNSNSDKSDNFLISDEDIYVVWLCKVLQNHKALLSTSVSDGMYYEITYNGDKDEFYFDAYKKRENKCIKNSCFE